MKLMVKNILALIMVLTALATRAQSGLVLASPNKKISFRLFTSEGGLRYEVRSGNKAVIEMSPLGIMVNKVSFGEKATMGKTSFYSKNETFPYRGVHSVGLDYFKGAKVSVMSNGLSFTIEIRVFNDGVGFSLCNREQRCGDNRERSYRFHHSSISHCMEPEQR